MGKKWTGLTPDQLRRVCPVDLFRFDSTESFPGLEEVIGQDRAVEAIDFGVNIDGDGFNIYALGPAGAGRTSTVKLFVEARAKEKPVPSDWCYVYNFSEPHKPVAIRLSQGQAKQFRRDMEAFVQEMLREIPRALESEAYENERNRLIQNLQDSQKAEFFKLEQNANERSFTVRQAPQGIFVVPMVNGKALEPQQYAQLSEEQRQELDKSGEELQGDLQTTLRTIRQLEREVSQKLQDLERQTVVFALGGMIDEMNEKYRKVPKIGIYLDAVREDVVNNARAFIPKREQQAQSGVPGQASQTSLNRYAVNVIVDNSVNMGAPVILENNPTFSNLIGRIERQPQYGMLVTDFTMIKPGALHCANGGYLLLEIEELLRNPFSWQAIKRALKDQVITITDLGQELSMISTVSLEPEPIPLDVKIVLIGPPMIYYMMLSYDEDFHQLFKVKAEFNTYMERTEESVRNYASFLAGRCQQDGLHHFAKDGIARMVEYGSELVGDQTKLSTRFADICDLMKEADYWSRKNNHPLISRSDVQQAIDAKIRRANRVEEVIQKMIDEGDIFISTEGRVVGQVNGLSVMSLGDYMFGKPSRITARTYVGKAGILNVEREVKMSGPIHNKGVLILAGYMNGKYAQERPISLSASIGFEQLYEGVEGDSASSTELYSLLSSLSGFPIKQSLAVTGSVNQRGEIQPIGGATQKVEGFFEVCKSKGLTGEQGVLIPRANIRNLMLKEEVVQAVADGKFHIYPVDTIDQGIEILTDREAGELQEDGSYPEGTVNWAVDKKLREFANYIKEHNGKKENADKN